jgi:peroxiredoxin
MVMALLLAGMTTATSPEGRIPDVGDRLPTFTATDPRGRSRALEDLRGRNGLVLVFFRSADW